MLRTNILRYSLHSSQRRCSEVRHFRFEASWKDWWTTNALVWYQHTVNRFLKMLILSTHQRLQNARRTWREDEIPYEQQKKLANGPLRVLGTNARKSQSQGFHLHHRSNACQSPSLRNWVTEITGTGWLTELRECLPKNESMEEQTNAIYRSYWGE